MRFSIIKTFTFGLFICPSVNYVSVGIRMCPYGRVYAALVWFRLISVPSIIRNGFKSFVGNRSPISVYLHRTRTAARELYKVGKRNVHRCRLSLYHVSQGWAFIIHKEKLLRNILRKRLRSRSKINNSFQHEIPIGERNIQSMRSLVIIIIQRKAHKKYVF